MNRICALLGGGQTASALLVGHAGTKRGAEPGACRHLPPGSLVSRTVCCLSHPAFHLLFFSLVCFEQVMGGGYRDPRDAQAAARGRCGPPGGAARGRRQMAPLSRGPGMRVRGAGVCAARGCRPSRARGRDRLGPARGFARRLGGPADGEGGRRGRAQGPSAPQVRPPARAPVTGRPRGDQRVLGAGTPRGPGTCGGWGWQGAAGSCPSGARGRGGGVPAVGPGERGHRLCSLAG